MTRPTMEGWMVRYGRRKIGRRFFHKRYSALESLVLAYYKRQPSANEVPLNSLPIDGNCRLEDRGLETHHGHTALRRSHLPLVYLHGHADGAIDPVGSRAFAPVASRFGSAQSGRLGRASSSLSTQALSSGVSWTPQRGVHWPRNFLSPSGFVRYQHYDRNGSISGDTSAEGFSSSGSSAVQPLQPAHLQSSLVADDFRSLIVSRKREVAILEAALEVLETAPRDKWFEDLVQKHNIRLEPFKVLVTQPEKRWKAHERNNRIESLNFGDAAKSTSNPREEESPVDPLRPNARAFLEQTDKKPYRSLADRLYEEQFGRPAPPGLKRTYPKGSFYDRCMKEKEQKERDAAAAATGAASSSFPLRSVSSPSSRSIASAASVSSQRDEAGDNSNSKNVISSDTKEFSPLGRRQSM